MFSFRSFTVLKFIFRSVVHLQFTFWIQWEVSFEMSVHLFQHHLLTRLIYLLKCLLHLGQKSILNKHEGLFQGTILFNWPICLLNSKTTLPWPLALWVLEWSSDSPFLFKIFFLSCLSIIDPFYFYINFTISLSISTNIQIGILIEVAMNLFYQIRWGENCHFDSTEFSNLCT